MEQILHDSLREIASLLLLLHEKYLREDSGRPILVSLVHFLDDAGLHNVSIADAERLRRLVSRDSQSMNYEQFYEFLRQVADFLFGTSSESSRRALHTLLTHHILPLATSSGSHSPLHQSNRLLSLLPLCTYVPFLMVWYSSLASIKDSTLRLSPLDEYWGKMLPYHSSVTVRVVLRELLSRGGVEPAVMKSSEFQSILLNHVSDSSHIDRAAAYRDIDINDESLSFDSFLSVVAYVAPMRPLTDVQSAGLGDSQAVRSELFIMSVARCLLEQLFETHRETINSSSSSISTAANNGRGLSIDSVLWMCRQAGLNQIDGVDIPFLFDEISLFADSSAVASISAGTEEFVHSTGYVPFRQLPMCLCRTVERSTSQPSSRIMTLTGVDEVGRVSLYIAFSSPALLFSSPLVLPSPLCHLYTSLSLAVLRNTQFKHWLSIAYESCGISEKTAVSSSGGGGGGGGGSGGGGGQGATDINVYRANVHGFVKLCVRRKVCPVLISEEKLRRLSVYSLSNIDLHQSISLGDFLELLCVVSNNIVTSIAEYPYHPAAGPTSPASSSSVVYRHLTSNIDKLSFLLELLVTTDCSQVKFRSVGGGGIAEAGGSTMDKMSALLEVTTSPLKAKRSASSSGADSSTGAKAGAGAGAGTVITDAERERDRDRHIREVILLLIHFPLNNVHLNPWEVMQILLSTTQRMNKPKLHPTAVADADSNETLGYVFEEFCVRYQVSAQELSVFFAAFYLQDDEPSTAFASASARSSGSGVQSGGVHGALQSSRQQIHLLLNLPFYDLLLLDRTLRMLYANAELLRWEYCRQTLRNESKDPFTAGLVNPLPTVERIQIDPSGTLLSRAAALQWACSHTVISVDDANRCLNETLLVSSLRKGSEEDEEAALTFSTFVIFAVRCCSWTVTSSTTPVSTTRGGAGSAVALRDRFLTCVKSMLEAISAQVTDMQNRLHIQLLPMLMSSSGVVNKIGDGSIDLEFLLTALISSFDAMPPPSNAPQPPYLPPRIPGNLWDAPRALEFAKYSGILQFFETSIFSWQAYGEYFQHSSQIRSRSGSDLSVGGGSGGGGGGASDDVSMGSGERYLRRGAGVTPLPLKASPLVALNLIQWMCREVFVSKFETSSLVTIDQLVESVMVRVIIPQAVGYLDSSQREASGSHHSAMLSAQMASRSFEDILRYLGDKGMAELSRLSAWLSQTYDSLCGVGSDEASLPVVCRYLSCHGLLRSGTIAVQAKRALHPRSRRSRTVKIPMGGGGASSSKVTRDITVSRMEFEELFVRCAFILWELSGAAAGNDVCPENLLAEVRVDSMGAGVARLNASSISKLMQIAERYCAEATLTLSNKKSSTVSVQRSSAERLVSAWGREFLTPFAAVLMSDLVPLPGKESFPLEQSSSAPSVTVSNFQLFSPTAPTLKFQFGALGIIQPQELLFHKQINEPSKITRQDIDRLQHVRGVEKLRASTESQSQSQSQSLSLSQTPTAAALMQTTSNHKPPVVSAARHPVVAQHLDRTVSAHTAPAASSAATVGSTSTTTQARESRREMAASSQDKVPISVLLDGTKEALWPVFATYCSCGDSSDPGKLSGPNLFSLLSKLGILTDSTALSDLGVLLHQISAHAHSQPDFPSEDALETPALTFEEFIVFLGAFSQLRFDGIVAAIPITHKTQQSQWGLPRGSGGGGGGGGGGDGELARSADGRRSSAKKSATAGEWYLSWSEFMQRSPSFRTLLQQYVHPILQRHLLLAFPEDARHRDRYVTIFSLEVLVAVEAAEKTLKATFLRHQGRSRGTQAVEDAEIASIMIALRRINLVPKIMREQQVLQLMRDVMPTESNRSAHSVGGGGGSGGSVSSGSNRREAVQQVLFPQWEWVLCVVAFEAVHVAVQESSTYTQPEKIPLLVADIITSIANAMKAV